MRLKRHSPTTLQIPADLTLLLRRQVLSEYALACEAAQSAAAQSAIPDHPSERARDQLVGCRARVNAAEHVLNLVSTFPPGRAWKVSSQSPDHRVIVTLLCTALRRQSADSELTDEEVLAAADRLLRLPTLLDLAPRSPPTATPPRGSSSATISGDLAGVVEHDSRCV